jgi:predicted homoserine dehydrogenase-like protein
MNLFTMLQARADSHRPIRVGLIGAGKFGSMYLAQARVTPAIHIVAIADLRPERARLACRQTNWPEQAYGAKSLEQAFESGATFIGDDAACMINSGYFDVVIDATGDPRAGIQHCALAIHNGAHIIMVNVEADVVAGPLLAQRARAAGLIYSLAYGDQPAIICEQVDWARTCGFEVVCAGKGTRYHPDFHQSNPDTVWQNNDFSPEAVARGDLNAKMFNSFIDGTKSGIEMSAVCNATGLAPQQDGLAFPPASRFELAEVCKPKSVGGSLTRSGTTETVSSLHRDRSPVENHLQIGTYVIVRADCDYVRHCFKDYRFLPDSTCEFSAMYRPTHMIGLELGVSVASIVLRREATGAPTGFRADVVATAKTDLPTGTKLDGEGGYCVWGKQLPAEKSLAIGGLPLGLANEITLVRPVKAGVQLTWQDVAVDEANIAVRTRREMEAKFGGKALEPQRS